MCVLLLLLKDEQKILKCDVVIYMIVNFFALPQGKVKKLNLFQFYYFYHLYDYDFFLLYLQVK